MSELLFLFCLILFSRFPYCPGPLTTPEEEPVVAPEGPVVVPGVGVAETPGLVCVDGVRVVLVCEV